MDTYGFLRLVADSWALLALTLVFVGIVLWSWRPGSKSLHDEVAASIFRNDTKPAGEAGRGENRAHARSPKEA